MLNPVERLAFACRTCFDVGKVSFGTHDGECPSCSSLTGGERTARLRADTAQRVSKPGIRESDLTTQEREEFGRLRACHTEAHSLTILVWIEGRRYDPAKDVEFLALCERRLRKWRFLRLTNDGPLPGWAASALAGAGGDASDVEREWVDSLRESRKRAA